MGAQTSGTRPGGQAASRRPRSSADIALALRGVLSSVEPAVVLSSLARATAPGFSDSCTVELIDGVESLFRVTFPMPDEQEPPLIGGGTTELPGQGSRNIVNAVSTPFDAASALGYPSFAGVVFHSWGSHSPTADDAIIARLLVERAVATVYQQRVLECAARTDDRAAKLTRDLISSRVIGEAVGFLMAKHRTTRDEAQSWLRTASHRSQRLLAEVAAAVMHTGDLESPLTSDAEPRELGALQVVPANTVASPRKPPSTDGQGPGRRTR